MSLSQILHGNRATESHTTMRSPYGMLIPAANGAHAVQLPNGILPWGAMTPPPDSSFPTRDALLDYVKKWAANQGYAVVIGRSRTNRLWLRCDRGGEYRDKHANDPSARQRKRKESRLTGCEFSIKAYMRKDSLWRVRYEKLEHNHGPFKDLRDHPSLRRMTDEQLNKVYELTTLGKSPADIMDELSRLWPDIKVIRRDIYNARKNFKKVKDSYCQPSDQASVLSSAPASGITSTNASFEDPIGRPSGASESARWPWLDDEHIVTKKRKVGPSSRGSDTPATQSLASVSTTTADGPSDQIVMDSFNSVPTAIDSPLGEHPHNYPSWPQRPGSAQQARIISPTNGAQLPTTRASEGRPHEHTPPRNLDDDFTFTAARHLILPNNGLNGAVAEATHLGAQTASLSHTSSTFSQGIPNDNSNATSNISSQIPNSYYTQHNSRSSSAAYLQDASSNQQSRATRASPDASRRSDQQLISANGTSNDMQAGPLSLPIGALRPPSSNFNDLSGDHGNGLDTPANGQTSTHNIVTTSIQSSTSSLQQQQVQQATGRQQSRSSYSTLLPQQPAGPQLVQVQGLPKISRGAIFMQRVQRIEEELRDTKKKLKQVLSVVRKLDSSQPDTVCGAESQF